MNIRIVIDSTTDVNDAIRDLVDIVPLTITFGDTQYTDGVTIGRREFYEKLVESDALPTTSQPAPHAFARVYEQARQVHQQVVVLTVSSKLSGTYQSAVIAAEDYQDMVWVVDSRSVAIGAGILAELAVQLAQAGMDAPTIARQLETERDNVRLVALLDTLEYLKRGGRISKSVAFAGTLMSIKPVICIRDGAIEILGKARGSRQGNNLLVKEIEAAGGVNFYRPLMLGYTGLSDVLLQKYIEDSAALWAQRTDVLPQTILGSAVGTHAGPGAVAIAFFANRDK